MAPETDAVGFVHCAGPGAALRGVLRAAFGTLTALAVIGCVSTTLAYFVSTPAWLAQLSPFRVQYAALLAGHVLFCLATRHPRWATFFAVFAALNLGAVLLPGATSRAATAAPDTRQPPLRVLLANVLTSNRDPAPLLALIAQEKPDLIALLEINQRWETELTAALLTTYPHLFSRPREDNFGIAVFSRQPLGGERVEFFAGDELPSLALYLALGDGGGPPLRVLVTHPLPPGRTETTILRNQHLADLVDWTRSAATASLAFAAEPSPAPPPLLILGDLNATPWCPPLRRLLAATSLRPAARGHAIVAATWPAQVPFLRIPLDHALLNDELICTAYRVGPDIGSDHFPVLLEIRRR